jgi:hypothetical protein
MTPFVVIWLAVAAYATHHAETGVMVLTVISSIPI